MLFQIVGEAEEYLRRYAGYSTHFLYKGTYVKGLPARAHRRIHNHFHYNFVKSCG